MSVWKRERRRPRNSLPDNESGDSAARFSDGVMTVDFRRGYCSTTGIDSSVGGKELQHGETNAFGICGGSGSDAPRSIDTGVR
jgi:hypothetical protein